MLAPPALLNRAARYLQAAAAIVRDDRVVPDRFDATHAAQLADPFETEARAMRYYSDGAQLTAGLECHPEARAGPAASAGVRIPACQEHRPEDQAMSIIGLRGSRRLRRDKHEGPVEGRCDLLDSFHNGQILLPEAERNWPLGGAGKALE